MLHVTVVVFGPSDVSNVVPLQCVLHDALNKPAVVRLSFVNHHAPFCGTSVERRLPLLRVSGKSDFVFV